MADVIDVQNVLVNAIASAVYPNGTGLASVSGSPVIVYAGWPTSSKLDADLIIGKSHVTVFPTQIERNTTRYSKDWQQASINSPTLTITITGQTLVIGGTVSASQNVMAMVNNKPYVYAVLATDTLATVASALAALIAVDVPATSASAAIITCPNSARLTAARIGATGIAIREVRRQVRTFQLTIWADTPTKRDVLGSAIDVYLTAIELLTMPDNYAARLIYQNSHIIDSLQKAKLYRRDFQYSVEYATTQTEIETSITEAQLNTAIKADAVIGYNPINTTYF